MGFLAFGVSWLAMDVDYKNLSW